MIKDTTSPFLNSYPATFSLGKKGRQIPKYYFYFRPNNLNHKEISNQKNYQHSMARYTSGRDQNFKLSQDLSQWNITVCPGVHTK